jgi:hypothetical protein
MKGVGRMARVAVTLQQVHESFTVRKEFELSILDYRWVKKV